MKRNNLIKVLNLGRKTYEKGLEIQKKFQSDHLTIPNSSNVLLLVEHDPVYTLGLREDIVDVEMEKLRATGAEVIRTDRGGLKTFHGPGQLVAYPIFHLGKFDRLSLRNYVGQLEQVAIHTCRNLGVAAQISTESVSHTGAWSNGKKICAIGVHCKRYVTTHGLALNCNVDLSWFDHIVPCGILGKGVTSISNELQSNLSIEDTLHQFLTSFQIIFKSDIVQYDESLI